MSVYLVAILALLAGFGVLRFLLVAQPATIVRSLKFLLGLAVGIFGIMIFARGLFMFGFPMMLYGLALTARAMGWQGMPGLPLPGLRLDRFGRGGRSSSGGGQSGVRTRYLDMSLDHETGEMGGLILEGRFRGKRLAELNFEQAMMFLRDVRLEDPDSERLMEAWLDRIWPDWREMDRTAGGKSEAGDTAAPGPMSRAEAMSLLGLSGNPTADEVREAYKQAMKTAHPDQGGTDEDAARLNEARDLLLNT